MPPRKLSAYYCIIYCNGLGSYLFHSSPPSAAYTCQWIGSALVQIMACLLFDTKSLFNQCWDIVNWTLRDKLQWNYNQNIKLSNHENASGNSLCEMVTILSRGDWLTKISYFSIEFRPWLQLSHPQELWDIITHPCSNSNDSLGKLPLKLGHGWVITSHTNH